MKPSNSAVAPRTFGTQDTHAGKPRTRGVVKWFNDQKGFGFITPEHGGEDVFVHYRGIRDSSKGGYRTLSEGARVEYVVVPGRDNRLAAEDVVVIEAANA